MSSLRVWQSRSKFVDMFDNAIVKGNVDDFIIQ